MELTADEVNAGKLQWQAIYISLMLSSVNTHKQTRCEQCYNLLSSQDERHLSWNILE